MNANFLLRQSLISSQIKSNFWNENNFRLKKNNFDRITRSTVYLLTDQFTIMLHQSIIILIFQKLNNYFMKCKLVFKKVYIHLNKIESQLNRANKSSFNWFVKEWRTVTFLRWKRNPSILDKWPLRPSPFYLCLSFQLAEEWFLGLGVSTFKYNQDRDWLFLGFSIYCRD